MVSKQGMASEETTEGKQPKPPRRGSGGNPCKLGRSSGTAVFLHPPLRSRRKQLMAKKLDFSGPSNLVRTQSCSICYIW